jgi:ABC-type transport system substrate-binding protein
VPEIKRRALLGAAAAAAAAAPLAARADPGRPPRTLRLALASAEAGFDPPRVGDQSSIRVISHIFEPLLGYDVLARPSVLVPLTAARLPEASADFKRLVFTLKPGILFADDPVFQGRPRELTAADCVYTFKRFFDPALRTEHLFHFENLKLVGLSDLRQKALKAKTPFPYDVEVPGLRVLDRYRFELVMEQPQPRAHHVFAYWFGGAVAREVVEAYADDPMAHPVGTGPFRLAQWRRASRIVLERNPRYRSEPFTTVASPGEGGEPHLRGGVAQPNDLREAAERLKGRRGPLVDRIEIDIIDESQPRWLAFLGGQHDVLTVPTDFARLAVPGGQLAPFLAKQGVHARSLATPNIGHTYFNMDDPVVGGLAPEKVALRRAIALAYDSLDEIRQIFGGQAVPAPCMIPPGCYGHDAKLVSDMVRPSAARANALLDLYGYTGRDGDGHRRQPGGPALTLRIAFPPDQRSRAVSELWLKRMRAVGLRVVFEFAPFAELIRRSLAGQIMMWGFNWTAGAPDGDFFLGLAYGPNAEQSNDARFRLPAYDRLYERQSALPDGPERLALMQQCIRTMLAYVPYISHNHRIENDLLHAHVRGPMRHPFTGRWYEWIEVADA